MRPELGTNGICHGRYCELCRKQVFDFSDKSPQQIESLSDGELCGMFRVEQIEPDLVPIEVPFSLKATFLTIGTVLGLELSQVHGQIPVQNKIERVDDVSAKSDTMAISGNSIITAKSAENSSCEQVTKCKRKRYYFSKRFPFIVKRSIITIGRYRH